MRRANGRQAVGSLGPTRYNLIFRQVERELLPLCAEEQIGVIPYNPLAGGLLTGKHDFDAPPADGTRFTLGRAGENQSRYWHDREFAAVDALGKVASQAGLPMTTMAVAWVLANPTITSAIVGASRPDQLKESLTATDNDLDAALKARLDDMTTEWRMGDAAR